DRVAIVDKGILLALDTVNQLILDYGGMSGVTAEVAGFDKGKIETDLIAEFEVDGNEIQFFSARPFEAIDWLKNEQGIRFESLNLSRPNLESVFLSLTGRSLRD
ncbi:MAG: ABC transporter ATP-binding protein, partial [Planctomycetota bacterium]